MFRRTKWTAENGAGDIQSFSSGPKNATKHAHTEVNIDHWASWTERRGTENAEKEISVWCRQKHSCTNTL